MGTGTQHGPLASLDAPSSGTEKVDDEVANLQNINFSLKMAV
jgi:hypothetical protein